jgi:hypothetical protein
MTPQGQKKLSVRGVNTGLSRITHTYVLQTAHSLWAKITLKKHIFHVGTRTSEMAAFMPTHNRDIITAPDNTTLNIQL